ncbi:MAG: hypothetical protein WEB60_06495 [Terrimicrobiaceae bacterium]
MTFATSTRPGHSKSKIHDSKFLLLLFLFLLGLTGCGYNYRLPGHGLGKTAPVSMNTGTSRHALSERLIPIKFGYQLSLSSEDPDIVDVRFRGDPLRKANIWLVAKAPGRTIVHYGNVFNQTLPFGKSESRRLGVDLPQLPVEEPGAGTGQPRRIWLRDYSDGAFVVEVIP